MPHGRRRNVNEKTEKTEQIDLDFVELKGEVKAGFAGIEQQMKTIFEKLTDINHTLNGNGREGIVERVRALEERLNGTWKTLLILGWLADFAIAAGALVAVLFKN